MLALSVQRLGCTYGLCNSRDSDGRTLLLQLVSGSEAGRLTLPVGAPRPEKFLGRQFDPDFPLRGERVFLPIKHSPVELSSM